MKTILLLLLMTGTCFGDEITLNTTHGRENIYAYRFTQKDKDIVTVTMTNRKYFDVDNDSIKISCPDGYELKITVTKETKQELDKRHECDGYPTYRGCDNDIFDMWNAKTTGAEIKCIKESK